jgi:hypothetical protein
MKIKYLIIFCFLLKALSLQSQSVRFPIQWEAQALKDSLIAVFNYPVDPNIRQGFTDQLYARFPWLKALDEQRRYRVSLNFEYYDLLAGHGYLNSMEISSVNVINDKPIGDFAPIDLYFGSFHTGDAYTTSELNKKSGFREVSKVETRYSYYKTDYLLPDGYDQVGIIFQVKSEDPKNYRFITRPDGTKFDKEGGKVITGYFIKRIKKIDFDNEDNDLGFTQEDWKQLDDLQHRYFASYFYNKHISYFQKYQIDRVTLEPIIANQYILPGEAAPDLNAAVAEYQLRKKIPAMYDELQQTFMLVGPYGFDDANNAMISSLIYPCIEGDCNYGEGTVDMGKTTFKGTFANSLATVGVLSEKSSGIQIKVNFNKETMLLSGGEYISDPNLRATFQIKSDGIYFDVDTKSFSYVGTTKGLSGRSGLVDGIYTRKKEDYLEIYSYKDGVQDIYTATIRERTLGEYEYTGACKQVGDDIYPYGKGRISFPYYSSASVPIEVTGNLFEAILDSPEAMELLISIFEKNKEITTPYLKNWYQEYVQLKDANRYATIQKLSDEELIKFVFMENENKFKNLNIAHGNLSDLLHRDWRHGYGSKTILLINKKDSPSSLCISSQNDRYQFDEQCVSFEKRGDVQIIRIKTLTEEPSQFKLICEDCNVDDYYAVMY